MEPGKTKVLVTGAAGFIGSHVSEALRAYGFEVLGIDDFSSGRRDNVPEGCKLAIGDIREEDFVRGVFEEFKPRYVVHQAAQISVSRSVREPQLDAWVNVVGTVNLLAASARARVFKFVFASSGGAIYGDVTEPASEQHPLYPGSPYGVSKLCGEEYLRYFGKHEGLDYVVLRYGNVYGPRQDPHGEAGVVAIFAQALLDGRTPTIFGDGEYVRDYVYVEDVAEANLLALTAEAKNEVLNIGTGVGTTVNELYGLLCEAMGVKRAPRYGSPRPGDLRSSILDPSAAAASLGWAPRHSLRDGLRKTADWFSAAASRSGGADDE